MNELFILGLGLIGIALALLSISVQKLHHAVSSELTRLRCEVAKLSHELQQTRKEARIASMCYETADRVPPPPPPPPPTRSRRCP